MDPSLCFFPHDLMKRVKTPFFILNPTYDFWQIKNILVPEEFDPQGWWLRCKKNIHNCDSNQIEVLQGYRIAVLNTLREFQQRKGTGMFVNSCYIHCQTISTLTWHSPEIKNKGLVVLTVQAKSSALRPPSCSPSEPTSSYQQVSSSKATMLFGGLYLTTLGVGGIKGSLSSHGAEQFDEETVQGRRQRSTFFNYFVFCLSFGTLIAVTLVVWVEDNKGWQWGFGISTLTILLSIPAFVTGSLFYRIKILIGSPFTTIAKEHLAVEEQSFRDNHLEIPLEQSILPLEVEVVIMQREFPNTTAKG